MSFTKIEDFKDPATGEVDWKKYNLAEIANGEKCCECGGIASLFGTGRRTRCMSCRAVDEPGELRHASRLRCPRCRHTWNPGDCDDHEVYADGDHEVWCAECGHEFPVVTMVSYLFRSPEIEKGHKSVER